MALVFVPPTGARSVSPCIRKAAASNKTEQKRATSAKRGRAYRENQWWATKALSEAEQTAWGNSKQHGTTQSYWQKQSGTREVTLSRGATDKKWGLKLTPRNGKLLIGQLHPDGVAVGFVSKGEQASLQPDSTVPNRLLRCCE